MMVGGEAMSVELAHQLRSSVGGRVLNAYGSIEMTVWSTCHELTDERDSVPIGQPIANTRLCVMDEQQRIVPIGVPGELVVSGDGVGRGYLNQPELTDACFLTNDGRRMYRTGDLVRMRRDGVLEFLGRLDHQVKIRGNHINLPDIDSVLQSAPGVRKAVVQPQTDASGGQRLVAYVVPESSTEFSQNDLREFVRAFARMHGSLADRANAGPANRTQRQSGSRRTAQHVQSTPPQRSRTVVDDPSHPNGATVG